MKIYNIMTCGGWESSSFMGPCSMAWLGAVLVFFIAVFARRIIKDVFGMQFSQLFGIIVGLFGYFVVVSFTGALKWALLVGFLASIIGGFLLGGFEEE